MSDAKNTSTATPQPNLIIGAVEWVALPDLGVERLQARVDTGANSAALCMRDAEVFSHKKSDWVRFHVHLGYPKPTKMKLCTAPLVGTRSVRNPSGHLEERLVIETTLHLGWEKWLIELTLTNRENMSHRLLLGRSALLNRVLVNPSHEYLHGQPISSNQGIGIKSL